MRLPLLSFVVLLFLFSCKKDRTPAIPPPPPTQEILLKDIVVPNLPSPYYHFEYDTAGVITRASYSAGIKDYTLTYNGNLLSEMKNNTPVNKNRVQYFYNSLGQAEFIKYLDNDGAVFRRCFLTYIGMKIQKMEWEFKVAAGFVAERTVTFVYRTDGNLLEFTSHRFPFENQTEVTYTDHFDDYDDKINTDGFSVFQEIDEHLLLFPGLQFQKNNPRKEVRTSSSNAVTYSVNFAYTYNDKNAPLTKIGDLVFTSGVDSGKHFQTSSLFSYY